MPPPTFLIDDLIRWRGQTPALEALASLAEARGDALWLVGGAVRAALAQQNEPPADLDVCVVSATGAPCAETLARALAEAIEGHLAPLDPAFGLYRVVTAKETPERTIDLADALENDIERDLARRDLTINAMGLNLAEGRLLDPFEGRRDHAARVIRMTHSRNFEDDPLRLLRVFRFMAPWPDATLDAATRAAVETYRERLRDPAGERIHVEMFKLLSAPTCFPALEAMAQTGALEVLLPELTPTRRIPPNAHHHLNLFDHTLELVRQCERLLPTLPPAIQAHLAQPLTPFATRAAVVKLACLMHDVGKPETWIIQPNGRHTFYGHDQASETLAEGMARRWKLSRDLGGRVQKLARWHLYPCHFSPASTRKSVLKFLRRMGDDALDVTLLALADRHSTLGPEITPQTLAQADADHRWLMDQYFVEAPTLSQPRLLDGEAVMAILNLTPGRRVGEILAALCEAQQLGVVSDVDQARAWLLQTFG